MKFTIITCSLTAGILLTGSLQAQGLFSNNYDSIRTEAVFNTVGTFAADNAIDVEMTGNTITAAQFASKVASAYANNHGGVINFEDAKVVNTGADTEIANINTALRTQRLVANLGASGPAVTINRGPQWVVEASGAGNLGTSAGPGTASSVDGNINGEWFFQFLQNPAQRLPASGTDVLAGVTSWDFSFNQTDQIVAVGLSYLGRDNFQWYVNDNQPVLYAKASFSDGSTAFSQIDLEQQTAGNYDVFVGFEAPANVYLTGLHVWHRGNNNRAFGSIDDLGIVAVPEPSTYVAIAGLAALVLMAIRRRRR